MIDTPLTKAELEIQKVKNSNLSAKDKNKEYARLRHHVRKQQIESLMNILDKAKQKK